MENKHSSKELLIKRVSVILAMDEKQVWSKTMMETCGMLVEYIEKQETLLGMWVRGEIK